MGVYIPDELFVKDENQDKVTELLEKYFGSDIITDDDAEEHFFEELDKLDEPKVYKYLKETNW